MWVCAFLLVSASACGGSAKRRPAVLAPNASLGDCAQPESTGVVSSNPNLKTAHRDLNGDGREELAFADRALCRDGNCAWNLFTEKDGCSRYIGTVEGATLESMQSTGDEGFAGLRVWWKMPKGERFLVQAYRYRGSGYHLSEVLVCRQEGDDRLLCASEEPHEPSSAP